MNARTRLQAMGAQGVRRSDEHGSRAVRHLAGHTGRDTTIRLQRLQRGHLLERGAAARRFVARQFRQRCQLRIEAATVDGRNGTFIAGQRELFHLQPRDIPALGNAFRAAELRQRLRAVTPYPAGRSAERVRKAERLAREHGLTHGDEVHALHTACHHEVLRAAHHGLRGEVHRLLRRPALPVHGGARHMLRQASHHPRGSRDVAGQRAHGIDATVDHIIHGARVDARTVHERAQRVGTEVRRVNARQRTLLLADRRADRVDDIGFSHYCFP